MPEKDTVSNDRDNLLKLHIDSLDYTGPAILDAERLSEGARAPCGVCITGGGAAIPETAATAKPLAKK